MTDTNDILSNCVKNFRSSVELLDNSIKVLDDATRNVGRIKKVLQTRKVFGLVPELDLHHAAKTLADDLQPQITLAKSKFDQELTRLKRRKVVLANRAQLQRSRQEAIDKARDPTNNGIDQSKLERLKWLRNKKDRLKYSLHRHRLQLKKARLSQGRQPSLPPP